MDIEYIQHTTEFQVFDRKSIRIAPTALAIPIIAMANADGGTVALGVEDDGQLTGVDSNQQRLNELLRVPFDFCVPSVQVTPEYVEVKDTKGQPNHIVLLHIAQSMLVHANQADEVFYRVGDKSKKLTFEQRMQLVYAKGGHYYEDAPVNESCLQDIDLHLVEEYCKEMGYTKGTDRFLHENGYIIERENIKNQKYKVLTGAAILLFGKNPQKYFQRARVRVIRYEGVEERFGIDMNVVKDEIFTGGILRMTNDVLAFVKTQIKEHSYLGQDGRFTTVAQYPEFCWTEMIVNAIAHRDYSILGTDIQVKIFDDHLVVESPGILPGLVRTTNIREMHFSRNPKIAAYMHTYRLVKEFGEGVDRMFREMEAAGQPDPKYHTVEFIVKVSIWQHDVIDQVDSDPKTHESDPKTHESTPKTSESDPKDQTFNHITEAMVQTFLMRFNAHIAPQYRYSTAREQAKNNCWKILICIHCNCNISKEIISKQTDIKPSTLKTLIAYMRKADIIEYIGNSRDGQWLVKLV